MASLSACNLKVESKRFFDSFFAFYTHQAKEPPLIYMYIFPPKTKQQLKKQNNSLTLWLGFYQLFVNRLPVRKWLGSSVPKTGTRKCMKCCLSPNPYPYISSISLLSGCLGTNSCAWCLWVPRMRPFTLCNCSRGPTP